MFTCPTKTYNMSTLGFLVTAPRRELAPGLLRRITGSKQIATIILSQIQASCGQAKPRMAEGQGTCEAPWHLGKQETSLKWALGRHGHSIRSCSELARRKVGVGLSHTLVWSSRQFHTRVQLWDSLKDFCV